MSDVILVINAGSSSIKFAAFSGLAQASPQRLAHGAIDGIGSQPRLRVWAHDDTLLQDQPVTLAADPEQVHDDAMAHMLDWLSRHAAGRRLVAVGHRVVHGGTHYSAPVRVSAEVMAQLDRLVPLAPLHQPHNLAAIRAIERQQPGVLQVACFDTAFHAGQPWVAQAFALPKDISAQGIKRYGFHGLSYEYIAGELPGYLGDQAEGRVVVAHLGSGASMCAMQGRRSIDSTMGFTALDGLVMGTRCGNIDPGVLLYLMAQSGMTAQAVEHMLYHDSGMRGVSGISGDLRELQASDAPDAARAIELFVHRITRELGALAACLGGLDALVFTAGIGEHSAMVRERVCHAAAWLGIDLDEAANRSGAARISTASSRVSAWVIATDEESMMAAHTRALLPG